MAADPPFVVDLHAHYPMQFDPEQQTFRRAISRARSRHESLADRIRFGVLEIADKFFNRNDSHDGHAVTIDTLAGGNVGVVLSVAYCPFDELDLEARPGTPPRDRYFKPLHDLLRVVEGHVAADPRARVVRHFAELTQARADGKVCVIHAVEGGFHVGETDEAIARHTERLAELGAGYVTVAHLLWRRVSTNVPALPFLPDAVYRCLLPQPDVGLDPRGRTLVREMVRRGILIDLTHMSERGMDDVFALLDELDPGKTVPVIATHIACSFGNFAYNLKQEYVKRIADRGGVCGVLYCDHYVRDGRGAETKTFAESFDWICGHVDRLRDWGGDGVLAIGSDLDGFIKPTLAGLGSAANHRDLAAALEAKYGRDLAEKICHANALRVFEQAWMKPFAIR